MERNLLKITMLARAVKARAEHGTATDGNIVIISFDVFIQSSDDIFFFDVEKKKKAFDGVVYNMHDEWGILFDVNFDRVTQKNGHCTANNI